MDSDTDSKNMLSLDLSISIIFAGLGALDLLFLLGTSSVRVKKAPGTQNVAEIHE